MAEIIVEGKGLEWWEVEHVEADFHVTVVEAYRELHERLKRLRNERGLQAKLRKLLMKIPQYSMLYYLIRGSLTKLESDKLVGYKVLVKTPSSIKLKVYISPKYAEVMDSVPLVPNFLKKKFSVGDLAKDIHRKLNKSYSGTFEVKVVPDGSESQPS